MGQLYSRENLALQQIENDYIYKFFKCDADELESWIFKKSASRKNLIDNAELAARTKDMIALYFIGNRMIIEKHRKSSKIEMQLVELQIMWKKLLSKLKVRKSRLQEAFLLMKYIRNCKEMMEIIQLEDQSMENVNIIEIAESFLREELKEAISKEEHNL